MPAQQGKFVAGGLGEGQWSRVIVEKPTDGPSMHVTIWYEPTEPN